SESATSVESPTRENAAVSCSFRFESTVGTDTCSRDTVGWFWFAKYNATMIPNATNTIITYHIVLLRDAGASSSSAVSGITISAATGCSISAVVCISSCGSSSTTAGSSSTCVTAGCSGSGISSFTDCGGPAIASTG